jgi:DNA invertase Pin-like site-specific DNA recombinase
LNELLKIGSAYIRVSDERQDEYSPDSQLKKIREYAAKEGYFIPDEYVFYDDGISGKNVKKRNDFNRMIAMAKEKDPPFTVIYVWKFSRFARNQEQSIVYKNLLKKKGVSVVSVSESLPDGPYGALIERIIEWMDEFYLINLGVEVTRGMTEKASRGEPNCPPPFGYVMRDGKYYPDTESGNADIVKDIFEAYINGAKLREIAVSLGKSGIRTKFGNMPDNRWIEYMLRNPCYTGKLRWSLGGARAVSKRDFTNENIMIVDGHHEPLVSEEVWAIAQKMLDDQKKKYPKHAKVEQRIDYMLKGLVRCSACGGTIAMSSATSGKSKLRTMQCCNYARGTCHTSHSVILKKLEDAFLSGLEQTLASQTFAIVPHTAKMKSIDEAPDYDRMIALEERRLERAKEAYLAEIDTIEQYKNNKEQITARIKELQTKKNAVEPTKAVDIAALSNKVLQTIEFIKREDVTPQAKNEALRTIIEKIVYEKATENLAIYFHEI